MAKKQKTYYVSRNDSWHTYEFLEKRRMDPKWRDAYFAAKEQRKKEMIISVLIILIAFVALAVTFLVVNFYNGKTNIGGISETPSISSREVSVASSSATQEAINIEQENTQGNSATNTEDYYYGQMKDAWQRARAHRDSMGDDPDLQNSVQSPEGAVTGEYSNFLERYPEDEQVINDAYQRVMNGE